MAAGALTLLLCLSSFRTGKLTDIAKPYLGEYECKSATVGEEDYLDSFNSVIMELKKDGTYSLRCKGKDGKMHEIKGKYEYDSAREKVTFFSDEKQDFKREFPLKDGILTVCFQIGGKAAVFQFEQK